MPDGSAQITNLKGEAILKFQDKTNIKTVKVSSDGKRLLTVSNTSVSLWSMVDGKLISRVGQINVDYATFLEVTSEHYATVTNNKVDIWENDGSFFESYALPDNSSEIISISADSLPFLVELQM